MMNKNNGIDVNQFYSSSADIQNKYKKNRRKNINSFSDENEIPGKKRQLFGSKYRNNDKICRTPQTHEELMNRNVDSSQKFYSNCFPQNSRISADELNCLNQGLPRKTFKKSKEQTNALSYRLNGGNTIAQKCRTELDWNRTSGLNIRLNMKTVFETNGENAVQSSKRAKSSEKITNYFENKPKRCSPLTTSNSDSETPIKRTDNQIHITPLLSNTNNLSLNGVNESQTPKSSKHMSTDETIDKSRLFEDFNEENAFDSEYNIFINPNESAMILEPNTPIGLKNLGNTCYMNSIVQSIFALKFFIKDLEVKYNEIKTICGQTLDFPMTTKLLNLYKQFNGLRNEAKDCSLEQLEINLSELKECVGKKSSPFLSGSQEDAAEFFTHVIDTIAEEFESISEFDFKNNPIWRNFGFETGRSLTCKRCTNRTNIENERFHALYLSIPEDNSLQTAFHDFLKDETTGHQCVSSHCNNNENVLKKFFTKLSKVLFLQLGRYTEDGSKRTERVVVPQVIHLSVKLSDSYKTIAPSPLATPYRSKLQNISICNKVAKVVRKISFENISNNENAVNNSINNENICLISDNSNDCEHNSNEICALSQKQTINSNNLIETNVLNESKATLNEDLKEESLQILEQNCNLDDVNEKQMKYQLVAVICHHGLSLSVGHYTSYVYSIETDQWFRCDDNDISLTNFECVQKYSQTSGYCYFYVLS